MTANRPASAHRLVIDRWSVTYQVPQGTPLTYADRARLDETLRTEVAAAMAHSVETSIDSADPSVWRIRSLSVVLSQQSSPASTGAAAQQGWATSLAGAILGEMDDDTDSRRVLRFASRADYLACFLVDLVRGRAWDRWYFEEFDSLRPLSTSRAICEALLQHEGDVAPTLIALLSIRGLHDILETLNLIDARRLLDSWSPASTPSASPSGNAVWVSRLLEIWSHTPCRIGGENLSRDGLWWLAVAASHYQSCEFEREPAAVVASLLEIRSLFLSLPSKWHRGRLVQLIAQGQLNDAMRFLQSPHASSTQSTLEALASMMDGDLDWGLNAISILAFDQDAVASQASDASSGVTRSHSSRFAGVFRLGPSFLATSAAKILAAAFRDVEDAALLPLLIHLVAAKCLGVARATASLDDVALHLFSGLGPGSFTRSFDHALSAGALIGLDLGAIQAALLDELLSTGHTDPERWVVIEDSYACLLVDSETREWLRIALSPDAISDPLALPSTPQPRIVSGRAPAADLDYFSLIEVLHALPPQLDLVLTLVAHRVFAHFTRRLMGFQSSSPLHIYENFLAGSGTLLSARQALQVTLSAPPLAIVLRLAGIDRETFTLPWLSADDPNHPHEGKEVCILQDPD